MATYAFTTDTAQERTLQYITRRENERRQSQAPRGQPAPADQTAQELIARLLADWLRGEAETRERELIRRHGPLALAYEEADPEIQTQARQLLGIDGGGA